VFTAELQPRSGPPQVLFTADASDPRKRVSVLLAAMPRVLDAVPDARLVLAGGGGLPEQVDERVRRATEAPGVIDLADVPAYYRRATMTVLPSVDEAFGLVLAESLACGTPVVGTESGGITDIVSPDVGELVPPDDPTALAEAIVRAIDLARHPDTPARCVQRARQWDWDYVGPQHLAAYNSALRR
ncbi:MAG TPA: glycosyltransferase, partial [Mycobacteriales bacterium]|nr:glycosyltransferase [Mycobacteriales bacterium]